MKPSSQSLRTPSRLSESVFTPLNMYALAASAAGVGILALAPTAEAKVVYTPAHRHVGSYQALALDLDHDGTIDFLIVESNECALCESNWLHAKEALGNAIEGGIGKYGRNVAAALKRGVRIGPGQQFVSRGYRGEWMASAGCNSTFCSAWGPWVNVTNRYLGLKFKVHGQAHYGWARLTVRVRSYRLLIEATLTGYAYETIPNKPIIAGKTKGPDVITLEPASLGRLARGSAGHLRKSTHY